MNLAIWGIWWPLMVWFAVFFGRIWCALCPLELVSNVGERLGRATGLRQKGIAVLLRSGVVIVFLYAVIQMLVAGIHLHRVPAYTSFFLVGLLAMALIVGFFFRDRAFCRGFCPVGLLLAGYGRGSMLAVRPLSREPCGACAHRSCTDRSLRHRLDGRSCPSLLDPSRLDGSKDCLLCGQCIKSCSPERNMSLFLRRPFHRGDRREQQPGWPMTLFTMILSGFVAYELCTEWAAANNMFLTPPGQMAVWLGLPESCGWIQGFWMLFLFPMLLWLLLGFMVLAGRGATSLGNAWRSLVWPLLPLIAAGHMAKGAAKFSSWAGYLPLALEEPDGIGHAQAITAETLAQPEHLLPKTAVALISISLLALFTAFGFRENSLRGGKSSRARILPILAIASVECYLLWGWGFGS